MAASAARDLRVVLVAAPEAEAMPLARGLVEARIAACVGLVPMRSVYRWKGAVEEAAEVQLVIKTAASFLVVQTWIQAHHSYEVPEIVELPMGMVETTYGQWLRSESGG